MQYSIAVAALIAGASAQYKVAPAPVPEVSSSSAVASTAAASTSSVAAASSSATQAYPVASSSKVSSAAESKTTPAATYPAAASTPAGPANGTAVSYTTEIVDKYTTYCPGPTQITYGTQTYTVTAPTTLTITDCPCTISKPVYTTSAVSCAGGACASPSGKPAPPPTYGNGTVPVVPGKPTTLAPAPTGGYPTKPTEATTPSAPIPTAGAGKVAAFGGLAGLVAMLAL